MSFHFSAFFFRLSLTVDCAGRGGVVELEERGSAAIFVGFLPPIRLGLTPDCEEETRGYFLVRSCTLEPMRLASSLYVLNRLNDSMSSFKRICFPSALHKFISNLMRSWRTMKLLFVSTILKASSRRLISDSRSKG